MTKWQQHFFLFDYIYNDAQASQYKDSQYTE